MRIDMSDLTVKGSEQDIEHRVGFWLKANLSEVLYTFDIAAGVVKCQLHMRNGFVIEASDVIPGNGNLALAGKRASDKALADARKIGLYLISDLFYKCAEIDNARKSGGGR